MYKRQQINNITISNGLAKSLNTASTLDIHQIMSKNLSASDQINKHPKKINNIKTSKVPNIIIENNNNQIVSPSTKNMNNVVFDNTKINLIVSWCFIPNWVIMYTFYLLEQKMFDSEYFAKNGINIIPITNFYNTGIIYQKLDKQTYNEILGVCYDNMMKAIMNRKGDSKIVLYMINNVTYDMFFKKYTAEIIKKSQIKIVLWRDDLFTFSHMRMNNLSDYQIPFKSQVIETVDLIVSPSIKYFENNNSQYIKKTIYYPYALDESVYNKINMVSVIKKNKILISGETYHFVYKRRREICERKLLGIFEKIQRPRNKVDSNATTQYKHDLAGSTGYYSKLNSYKGCIMTLAEYPVDFMLGKFIEVFNTESMAFLDYSYEIDKRLLLEPYEGYIPVLWDKNNFAINDDAYYRKFMNDHDIYARIVRCGTQIVRKYFSLNRNKDIFIDTIKHMFRNKSNIIFDINTVYEFNITFEEFNIFIGQMLYIISNSTEKIKICINDTEQKKILDILCKDRIEYCIIAENKPPIDIITEYLSDIMDSGSIKENLKIFFHDSGNRQMTKNINNIFVDLYDNVDSYKHKFIKQIDNDYLWNNCINDVCSLQNKLVYNSDDAAKKKYMIVIVNSHSQKQLALELLNVVKEYQELEFVILSMSKNIGTVNNPNILISKDIYEDIYYINNSELSIIFTEEYSAFIKNCGCKWILLFQQNTKKIINRLYNPFGTHEITVCINNHTMMIDIYEINKIAFMIQNKYRVQSFSNLYNSIKINIKNFIIKDGIYDKYYYYGEFGYFHTTVLGSLDEYFTNNQNKIIKIKTYDDFAKILELKFPDNIVVEKIPLEKDREFHKSSVIPPHEYKNLIDGPFKIHKYLHIQTKLQIMKSPITYLNNILPEKHKNMKYIAIFPRNRLGKFSKRNMTVDHFNKIEICIKNLLKFRTDYKIILVGNRNEINQEIINKYPHYGDIYETVYLMNNHIQILISPDSGYIDFAKNCMTKNIFMTYSRYYLEYHDTFNPFNINFMTYDYDKNSNTDFNNFEKYINKLI